MKEYLEELEVRKKRDWKTVEAVHNFLRQMFPRQELGVAEIGPRHYAALVARKKKLPDGTKVPAYADATHQRALGAALRISVRATAPSVRPS